MSGPELTSLGAVIAFALLIARRRALRRVGGPLPATLLGAFLLASGALGPTLWNASAPHFATGIPVFRPMTIEESGSASMIFLVASLGPVAVALLSATAPVRAKDVPRAQLFSPGRLRRIASIPSVRRVAGVGTLAVLVLWLIGQGAAAWQSEAYLSSTGPLLIQRLSNPLAPVGVGAAAFLVISSHTEASKNPLNQDVARLFWLLVLLGWWMVLATKGTRLAILAGFLLGLVTLWSRNSPRPNLLGLVWGFVMALASTQYVLISRASPHGLTEFLPITSGKYGVSPFAPDSLLQSVGFLAKNLSGYVFVTGQSATLAPSRYLIGANLNPLPGAAEYSGSIGPERYLPWVPLSTLGEIYGAFGPIAVAFLTATISALLVVAVAVWGRGTLGYSLGAAAYGLVPTVSIFLVQYSTRNTFRILWFLAALALVSGAYRVLIRSSRVPATDVGNVREGRSNDQQHGPQSPRPAHTP